MQIRFGNTQIKTHIWIGCSRAWDEMENISICEAKTTNAWGQQQQSSEADEPMRAQYVDQCARIFAFEILWQREIEI